jgi:glutaminase
VSSVLSIMGTCGMYNYAGEWIYRVGMPAKSGVSGGVLASLAGQLGIGVFSPRLDDRGNTVRGVLVCDSLSRAYSLNMLNVPNISRETVRACYDATEVPSKRARSADEATALAAEGGRIRVYELQGQLNFASVERFSRDAVARAPATDLYVIDFKRAARIDTGAIELFSDLMDSLLTAGKLVALSDAEHLPGLAERVDAIAMTRSGVELAENRDRAIEWCEDRLLERLGAAKRAAEVPLASNDFCRGLSEEEVEKLAAVATHRRAKAGERLVQAGTPSGSVFLLVHGEVSVTIDLPQQEHARLATHSAGMAFGQTALVGELVRAADVTADADVEYYEVRREDIESLGAADPAFLAAVYRNVAEDLASHLRSTEGEIRALSS